MNTIRMVLRATGEKVNCSEPMSIERIRTILQAEALDTVRLADRVHVMPVDDSGYDKDLPVNAAATELYLQRCIPGTTHQIRGDVVVVPDSDFGAFA